MKAPFPENIWKRCFFGAGRRCTMLRRRAAVSSHRCALKCLRRRVVRRVEAFCVACGGPCGVSGWHLWRVGWRVGACGGPCGVSNFVESWIFLSICEKKPINGRIRGAKYVEFCRKVSKVGFFSGCRKKSQEKRYFKYIFFGFFRDYGGFVQLWTKSHI